MPNPRRVVVKNRIHSLLAKALQETGVQILDPGQRTEVFAKSNKMDLGLGKEIRDLKEWLENQGLTLVDAHIRVKMNGEHAKKKGKDPRKRFSLCLFYQDVEAADERGGVKAYGQDAKRLIDTVLTRDYANIETFSMKDDILVVLSNGRAVSLASASVMPR